MIQNESRIKAIHIPYGLVQQIGYKATTLLATIWAYGETNDGICLATIDQLTRDIGWSKRTTQNHLRWLELNRYIIRKRTNCWQGSCVTIIMGKAKAWFDGTFQNPEIL